MVSRATIANLRLSVPMDQIEQFCQRRGVTEFALFGSVLRDDFGPASDVDVLIRFDPSVHPTLFTLARMEKELESVLGRRVDLLERKGVEQMRNPYFRRSILQSAQVIYARREGLPV